jgi:hypothetical protein
MDLILKKTGSEHHGHLYDVFFTSPPPRFLARYSADLVHLCGEQFQGAGILVETDKLDLVVSSLAKESLRQVIDVLESPDIACYRGN